MMNPKLNKHFPRPRAVELGALANANDNDVRFTKTSVRDQAVLLLSIADIAKTEINKDGLAALWVGDEGIPNFPMLTGPNVTTDYKGLTPRPDTLCDLISTSASTSTTGNSYHASRIRSVSIEYSPSNHALNTLRATSPLLLEPTDSTNLVSPGVSPLSPRHRRLPTGARKQSLRLSHKARKEQLHPASPDSDVESSNRVVVFADNDKKGKPLQNETARGVIVKKILRKKFSWKNYPEVSAYLLVEYIFVLGFMHSLT
jgi:hypothetical protein